MYKLEDFKNPELINLFRQQKEHADDLRKRHHKLICESHMTCPCCGAKLHAIDSYWSMLVCDGNTVYLCADHQEHRFWRNARERYDMHLHINASETTFESERDFLLEGTEWIEYTEGRKAHRKLEQDIYEAKKRQREEYYKTHPEARAEDEKYMVKAKTFGLEEVKVQPMGGPIAFMPYLDMVYAGKKSYPIKTVWKDSWIGRLIRKFERSPYPGGVPKHNMKNKKVYGSE